MTETEALRYALSWLRAFPALPTATPGYAERRAAAVERLSEMLRQAERKIESQRERHRESAASGRARGLVGDYRCSTCGTSGHNARACTGGSDG